MHCGKKIDKDHLAYDPSKKSNDEDDGPWEVVCNYVNDLEDGNLNVNLSNTPNDEVPEVVDVDEPFGVVENEAQDALCNMLDDHGDHIVSSPLVSNINPLVTFGNRFMY